MSGVRQATDPAKTTEAWEEKTFLDLLMTDKLTAAMSCNPPEMFFTEANDRTLTLRGHVPGSRSRSVSRGDEAYVLAPSFEDV